MWGLVATILLPQFGQITTLRKPSGVWSFMAYCTRMLWFVQKMCSRYSINTYGE